MARLRKPFVTNLLSISHQFRFQFYYDNIGIVLSYFVRYAFQSESTLYNCLMSRNPLLKTGAISEV